MGGLGKILHDRTEGYPAVSTISGPLVGGWVGELPNQYEAMRRCVESYFDARALGYLSGHRARLLSVLKQLEKDQKVHYGEYIPNLSDDGHYLTESIHQRYLLCCDFGNPLKTAERLFSAIRQTFHQPDDGHKPSKCSFRVDRRIKFSGPGKMVFVGKPRPKTPYLWRFDDLAVLDRFTIKGSRDWAEKSKVMLSANELLWFFAYSGSWFMPSMLLRLGNMEPIAFPMEDWSVPDKDRERVPYILYENFNSIAVQTIDVDESWPAGVHNLSFSGRVVSPCDVR